MGDFRTYVTQDVVVPQESEHDEEPITEGHLIDTTIEENEIQNHNSSQNNIPNMDMHLEIIQEREFLRSQCEKLRLEKNNFNTLIRFLLFSNFHTDEQIV